jgi:putative iron-dependent peroxidase
VQKYLHDLPAWDALPVDQQEAAIGRTKLNDIELADQAPDSHVVLNQIVGPDGAERPIMRFNMPFGRVGAGEYGTYFIGYTADPGVIEQMLEHMFIGNPPGTTDRILDFSTAVTGGLFFVPSADFMDEPPEEPPGEAPGDGSLGIGGLRD